MTFFRVTLSLLSLLGACYGQGRGGTDPTVAVPLLTEILGRAGVSGSLEYWGRCDSSQPYPDFPALDYPPNDSGSPVELLRKVFARDPKMQIRQDPSGVIRMSETDVPTDLLDFIISHLSFGASHTQADMFGGPNSAMILILSNPDVLAYRRTHNLRPDKDAFVGPGNSYCKQRVTGDLDNVSVRDALDFILKSYPGLWFYENCNSDQDKSGRDVFIGFFQTYPKRTTVTNKRRISNVPR